MISAGEFRNGVTFEQDGQVLQVVEFQHVKPVDRIYLVCIESATKHAFDACFTVINILNICLCARDP